MGQAHPSWGQGYPHNNIDKMAVASSDDGKVRLLVHRELEPLVSILLTASQDQWDPPPSVKNDDWGFNNRPIGDTEIPSLHSWGIAIDLNAIDNPFDTAPFGGHTISAREAQLWKDYGFSWGGDWDSVKDWMHFEWNLPRDAVERFLEKARRELGGGMEEQMFKDYIAGEGTYRERFKAKGSDPGAAPEDKSADWKAGWNAARFGAMNGPAGGNGGGPHKHGVEDIPHRHDEGKTGVAESLA